MTGSTTLDVVIGLIFIYLLYSLLATIVQEAIANVLCFRAKFLEKAIARMLDDGGMAATSSILKRFGSFFRLFFRKSASSQQHPLTKAFYNYPLIKYLAEDGFKSKPSYLTAENFSQTLLNLLKGENFTATDDAATFIQSALEKGETQWKFEGEIVKISNETLVYLNALWADAKGDVEAFRKSIESWYDNTMEHATGWYKRHTQFTLFILGLIIAITFNVDTLKLTNVLSNNPEVREQVVQQAQAYTKVHKDELKIAHSPANDSLDTLWMQANNLLQNDIANLNKSVGIGWKCPGNQSQSANEICVCNNFSWYSIIGWIITAFALSLGAPFWFDLLNKLMKLRGAVNPDKGTP